MITQHQSQYTISSAARWFTFFGVPLAVLGAIMVSTLPFGYEAGLARLVGEKALPYAIFFLPVSVSAAGVALHNRLPKRLLMPVGITGWILGLSLFYSYFSLCSGALKH